MSEINISEIQTVPIKAHQGLVAFASCLINNCIFIGNLAIYSCPQSASGFRIVYPTRKLKSGEQIQIVHPVTKEAGDIIERKIVEEYRKVIDKLMKGER